MDQIFYTIYFLFIFFIINFLLLNVKSFMLLIIKTKRIDQNFQVFFFRYIVNTNY